MAPPKEDRMRLDHAMLFVKDLERMTAFYRDVIGLQPVEATRLDDWVEFESGFALHAIPAHLAKGIQTPDPPRPREQDPCKLIFSVDDLDAEQARLTARGVTLLHRPWGGWDAIDPEGNVLGLRQA
jgi:catechol 2,3-dioxygenase-like lactoylglutathione lyase family enzyme